MFTFGPRVTLCLVPYESTGIVTVTITVYRAGKAISVLHSPTSAQYVVYPRGGSMTYENDNFQGWPRVVGWTGVSIGNKYYFIVSDVCRICITLEVFHSTIHFSVSEILLYVLEYKNEGRTDFVADTKK
jgi:hypothetical protein